MNAQVFSPRVPVWVPVGSAAGWVLLSATAVLLEVEDGFGPALLAELSSTAAGIALAVTGVGALVGHWQRRRMRERLGPHVVRALQGLTQGCGRLVACYAQAGSAVLSGGAAIGASDAAALLAPPRLDGGRDIQPLRDWRGAAFSAIEMGGEDDAAQRRTTTSDTELLAGLSALSEELASANEQLQSCAQELGDLDAWHADRILDETLGAGDLLARQTKALGTQDVEQAAQDSWLICTQYMVLAIAIADGADDCWRATMRAAGRRDSPLKRASDAYTRTVDSAIKLSILMRYDGEQMRSAIAERRAGLHDDI